MEEFTTLNVAQGQPGAKTRQSASQNAESLPGAPAHVVAQASESQHAHSRPGRVRRLVGDVELPALNYRQALIEGAETFLYYSLPAWNHSRVSRFLMKGALISGLFTAYLTSPTMPKGLDFDEPIVPTEVCAGCGCGCGECGDNCCGSPENNECDENCGCECACGQDDTDPTVEVTRMIGRIFTRELNEHERGAYLRPLLLGAIPLVFTLDETVGIAGLLRRRAGKRALAGKNGGYVLPAAILGLVTGAASFIAQNADVIEARYRAKFPERNGCCGDGDCGGCGDGGCCDNTGGNNSCCNER